jgi:outer membrane lipoprotein LolB
VGRGPAALLVAALLLCACASVPKPPAVMSGELLSGRMSVQVDAAGGSAPRAMSAAFELEGDAGIGRFGLVTPLGTVVAQARWQPGEVVLVTTQGETRFADLDALTRQVLGEPLPVAALFDWLRGRPWPGAASALAVPPAEPGFEQLGWSVNLARFDEAWVTARRDKAPAVMVRAKIDRP